MKDTYWNEKGKYQKEYDELIKLMPDSGSSDTLAGEIIRAASRIGYDYWNNGMINNTSGALNFLANHKIVSADLFSSLYEKTAMTEFIDSDDTEDQINELINSSIEFILNNPETKNTNNDDDIFNYQDEDLVFCEGCGHKIENSNIWISFCNECEDLNEQDEFLDDYEDDDFD